MPYKNVDEGFLHWFAGFVDGEGCFSVSRDRIRAKPYHTCQLQIRLRSDDIKILEEIQFRLGTGHLHLTHTKGRINEDGTYIQDVACLIFTGKESLSYIIEIFDKYPLRSKKQTHYQVWRKAVLEQFKGKNRDVDFLEYLRERLKTVRVFDAPDIDVDDEYNQGIIQFSYWEDNNALD